jgi:hypothetical protein
MGKKETGTDQADKKVKLPEWLQIKIIDDFKPTYEAFHEICENNAIDKSKLIRLWIANYVATGDPSKKGKK